MKKFISTILCLIIVSSLAACSGNNAQPNNSNQTSSVSNAENILEKKVFSYLGNDYPVNILPGFDVKYMYHYEDEEENVCWVIFSSDDEDKIDDIDNYDFSNGSAQMIMYFYNCRYNDLFSVDSKILGAYKYVYTGKNSDGRFDGWQIMYAPDGDVIFKTDIDDGLECGLHKIYYDNNDNIIAKYSGYDKENEKILFEKANGETINEDELRTLLESLCPNEYLSGLV